MTEPQQEYFPITKDELYRVKNDCIHPEIDTCSEICEHFYRTGDVPCTFSVDVLIGEILSRPINKAPESHQEHCEHECICPTFERGSIIAARDGMPCMKNHNGCKSCEYDTRAGPLTEAPGETLYTTAMVENRVKYAARAATLAVNQKWIDALNSLIATESKRKDKESVDMVYSYRIAQIIESLRNPQEPPK